MPAKHINEQLWKEIERITIDAVIKNKIMIKETEILHIVLKRGLEQLSDSDISSYLKKIRVNKEE